MRPHDPSPEDDPHTERVLSSLERIRPRLKRLMAVFQLSPEDAEDLVQNLAIVALTSSQGVARLDAWLMGAAWNLSRLKCRKEMRRELVSLDSAPEPAAPPPEDELIGRIDLDRATTILSPRHRKVFRLLVAGHRKQDIAARVGYSEKGLRKLILRASSRMAARYGRRAGLPRRRPPSV
jgi:DNA-directed RNA polymerase specialized sigma24 family protein